MSHELTNSLGEAENIKRIKWKKIEENSKQ